MLHGSGTFKAGLFLNNWSKKGVTGERKLIGQTFRLPKARNMKPDQKNKPGPLQDPEGIFLLRVTTRSLQKSIKDEHRFRNEPYVPSLPHKTFGCTD